MDADPKAGTQLEKIAKGTVAQQALNLSMHKMREDIVYENSNVNTFICDRMVQSRNKTFFPGKDVNKEWIKMEHVA